MKLVQDWSDQDKTTLLDRIKQILGDKEYLDIVVYGSRVSGDFTKESDLDVGVYVNEIKRCPCCQLQPNQIMSYVNNIHRPDHEFGNWFTLDITFYEAEDMDNGNWTQFGGTYDLPKYSLITNKFYEGNKEETKLFKSRKYNGYNKNI